MSWERHQQVRLATERAILRENMPDFVFVDPRGDTRVEGEWTSSANKRYKIVVRIPPGFPDECPSSLVAEPCPLLDHWERPMTDYGNSHEMHTWLADPDHPEWTRICTYRPESWSASHSIEKVLQKSMLWLEAYEAHLSTGLSISKYLLTMP